LEAFSGGVILFTAGGVDGEITGQMWARVPTIAQGRGIPEGNE